MIEAEREALEIAHLEVEAENKRLLDVNERLIEENSKLRNTAKDLERRLEGIPDAVAAAIAHFVTRG
jgi:hypothetical protein